MRLEDYGAYFYGDPSRCRFMLTTENVKSELFPAATHIDQTSGVQVIETGFLYEVLGCLSNMQITPVIVNTFFNIAGGPLVDSVSQAIRSFKGLRLDYLSINGALYANQG